jgi:hypothetical protein
MKTCRRGEGRERSLERPKSANTAKVKFLTFVEDNGADLKVNSLEYPPSGSPAM